MLVPVEYSRSLFHSACSRWTLIAFSQPWIVFLTIIMYPWMAYQPYYAPPYAYHHPDLPPPPPQGAQHFGPGAPAHYHFRYSTCTGRRRALLIGINYFGQPNQLRGCINDVTNMSIFLHEKFGYRRGDMVILTDDQSNPMSLPTKANILRAMQWLVRDAMPDDSLFIHFSGISRQPGQDRPGQGT